MKRLILLIVLLAFGMTLISMNCANETERQPREKKTITTQKGSFEVPGSAWMDGRDVNASPPLTLMNINAWDGVPRRRPICKLQHGSVVSILDAKYEASEKRYYFKVSSGNCTGWVSEPFISPAYQSPVGDQM